ncbi:MAG: hypothetical protein ABJB74_23035 [Gemmatimonas sp.]
MYATCLFCHASLGANESIEHFPVGKRLAFDSTKGRLWVVCSKCERWNLSPLDERWEAVEEAERAYRDTKKRVATDNVGLARLRDGTDLIRIGEPLRPEFAAWRYGDTFGRRRRKRMLIGTASVLGAGALVAGTAMGLYAVGGALLTISIAPQFVLRGWMRWRQRARQLTVMGNDRELISLSHASLSTVFVQFQQLSPDDPGQISLTVNDSDHRKPAKSTTFSDVHGNPQTFEHRTVAIKGEMAHRALSTILASTVGIAGSDKEVADAVGLLEKAASPYALLKSLPSDVIRQSMKRIPREFPGVVMPSGLPATIRLALEMSLHEESERHALNGELHELERRWKEAEEIAGIADSMLLSG